jgi:hypothetical protein
MAPTGSVGLTVTRFVQPPFPWLGQGQFSDFCVLCENSRPTRSVFGFLVVYRPRPLGGAGSVVAGTLLPAQVVTPAARAARTPARAPTGTCNKSYRSCLHELCLLRPGVHGGSREFPPAKSRAILAMS